MARKRNRPQTKLGLYLELTKSGIVTLVAISVTAGYLIGHQADIPISLSHFLFTILGVFFLASGASGLNQIQEIKLDAGMPRTAKRPLPSGRISRKNALVLVVGSAVLGLLILARIDWNVFWMGVLALFSYNVLYTLWWKRKWAFAAIPGAIPGALPVLMGFTAASGKVWDIEGIYLFAILFYWQMPHFWSLALRYEDDYRQGAIPTLPVARGSEITKIQIFLWTIGYIVLAVAGPFFSGVGSLYLWVAVAVSLKLLWEIFGYLRGAKPWIHFFLWINFSLIFYFAAMVLDLWSYQLFAPWFVD